MPLQKCVGEEAEEVLREVHEGTCGSHIRAKALAGVKLRKGYLLSGLTDEAKALANKCRKCQEHAHVQRLPSEIVSLVDYVTLIPVCSQRKPPGRATTAAKSVTANYA